MHSIEFTDGRRPRNAAGATNSLQKKLPVQEGKMMSVNVLAAARRSGYRMFRRAALDVLSYFGRSTKAIEEMASVPRVEILLLHDLKSTECDTFRRLIEKLGRSFEFVSYSQATAAIQRNEISKPLLTFSYDDGLLRCRDAAAILNEFGASGCFFVCPGIVGERDTTKIEQFCREKLRIAPAEFLDWDDCRDLIANGHEIGGHTMNHPNLASLRVNEAVREISESREILIEKIGEASHFAWPYGRFHHMTKSLVEASFAAGWKSCASGERGCHLSNPLGATSSRVLFRDSIETSWPWEHIAYFLACSTMRGESVSSWPEASQRAA